MYPNNYEERVDAMWKFIVLVVVGAPCIYMLAQVAPVLLIVTPIFIGMAVMLFQVMLPETKIQKLKRLSQKLAEIQAQQVPETDDDHRRIKEAVQREIDKEAEPIKDELDRLMHVRLH